MRLIGAFSVSALLASATSPAAETDFLQLSAHERTALRAEVRAVLLENPDLLRRVALGSAPPVLGYQDEIAADQARLAARHASIFAETHPGFGRDTAKQRIALFTGTQCPACAAAEHDLRELAQQHDLRVYLINSAEHTGLASALGVDTLPFYVFPKMMLRGRMPRVVLEGYLAQATGQ